MMFSVMLRHNIVDPSYGAICPSPILRNSFFPVWFGTLMFGFPFHAFLACFSDISDFQISFVIYTGYYYIISP